jgi:hypothetical protein
MWLLLLVQFVSLLHSLPHEDQRKELLLGLWEPGALSAVADAAADASSLQFVARRVSLVPTAYARPVLVVATHEVREARLRSEHLSPLLAVSDA